MAFSLLHGASVARPRQRAKGQFNGVGGGKLVDGVRAPNAVAPRRAGQFFPTGVREICVQEERRISVGLMTVW